MTQPPTPLATSEDAHRRAGRATYVVFAASGGVSAATLGRVPALAEQVGASHSELGAVLLSLAGGAVLFMLWAGRLVARFDTRVVVLGSAAATAAGWLVVGQATTPAAAASGLFVAGAGVGVWDVAMNIQGSAVERHRRRNLMPGFHAAFSAGGILGALVAALSAKLEVPFVLHVFAIPTLGLALVAAVVGAFVPTNVPDTPTSDSGPARVGQGRSALGLLGIGLLVASGTLGEGGATDWLTLHIAESRSVSPATAALGLAAFNVAMFVGRAAGGRVLDRVERSLALRVAGAATAVGSLAVALLDGVASAYVGAGLWGLGLALVFPVAMSAAGEEPASRRRQAIALVSAVGYAGFLAGPPVIGLVSAQVGLDRALLVVTAGALLVVALAPLVRADRPQRPARVRPVARASEA